MANQLEKFGLRPYRKLDGSPLVGAQNRYVIKAGNCTAIYQGDAVIPLTNGNIERATANTSDAVVGVFNGCFYTIQQLRSLRLRNSIPGSITPTQGDITAFVVDDPDQYF